MHNCVRPLCLCFIKVNVLYQHHQAFTLLLPTRMYPRVLLVCSLLLPCMLKSSDLRVVVKMLCNIFCPERCQESILQKMALWFFTWGTRYWGVTTPSLNCALLHPQHKLRSSSSKTWHAVYEHRFCHVMSSISIYRALRSFCIELTIGKKTFLFSDETRIGVARGGQRGHGPSNF